MTDEARSERRFRRVQPRTNVDYMLRTAQQHHAQISSMADTKANILITVSSIVLTLSLSRFDDPSLRPAVITLAFFTLTALLLAVLAILPRFERGAVPRGELSGGFNLLFFGHFSLLDRDRYLREMEAVLEDDARTYETVVNDLYSLGTYLYARKYRYLRFSYLALLSGFVAAALIQLGALGLG